MDEKSLSSTVIGSSPTVNQTDDTSPTSSRPEQNAPALEAADYLVECGLTFDHRSKLIDLDDLVEPRKLVTASGDSIGLTSCEALPECSIPASVSAPEKLEDNDKSDAFLREVLKRESEADIEQLTRQVVEPREQGLVRQLKIELPMLRTDEAFDLRDYKRQVRAAKEVRITSNRLPLEPCDDKKDEGLEFPPQAHAMDEKILRSIEREKLEISKMEFETLEKYLRSDWTEEDQNAFMAREVVYKGVISREPVTPPLTPRPEDQDVFLPDAGTCAFPAPSSPDSLLSDDLTEAEKRIFDGEGEPSLSNSDMEKYLNFGDADEVTLALPSGLIQKRANLEVEPPLLPGVIDEQPPPSPDFGGIKGFIPQDTPMKDDPGVKEADDALDESMKETAAKVMMEIEQEKLEPLDGSVRVEVPVLDFSKSEPEWVKLNGDSKAIFKAIPRESDVSFSASKWTRKLIHESKMTWNFWKTQLPKPEEEEPIDDAALLDKFLRLDEEANLPTSSDYVRKKPGLRVLDDDPDDDEEIEAFVVTAEAPQAPQVPQTPQGDWLSLLKKRKPFVSGDSAKQKTTSKRKLSGEHSSSVGALKVPTNLLAQEEEGAAATLLDNYLELHAPKKPKLDSPFFKKPDPAPATAPQPAKRAVDKPPAQPEVDIPAAQLFPCPEILDTDMPVRLITAVTLSRTMITHLERFLPGIQMIDRDYNAHNTSVWMPGSVRRSEVVASALANEADLILSPSTGIILTTMIKVRQRYMPGGSRSQRPHLTTRVEAVAARYERLIVLVSEDNRLDESANDLASADAAAFADFQGFAAALSCEVVVMYVGGGPETLAKWAAAMVARYAAGSIDLQGYLMQMETEWELFLRRAGMNVYAAQVVLGMLRAPVGEPVIGADGMSGLPAFVTMSQQERIAMFEAVMGGRRVLGSVGRLLDASWGEPLSRPLSRMQ
ncbi:hypothetical protein GE09DRAFT_1227946 [Coniochaeta sp. 2T2.1]|nr:hypothetical protein GE09DRAFT_1227946 [Coniochaeta sp. 2T2.1]